MRLHRLDGRRLSRTLPPRRQIGVQIHLANIPAEESKDPE